MRQLTKSEQREYIGPQARKLAKSGQFSNWLEIEHQLRFEEYCPEARHVIDNELTREELDRICKEARKTYQS